MHNKVWGGPEVNTVISQQEDPGVESTGLQPSICSNESFTSL